MDDTRFNHYVVTTDTGDAMVLDEKSSQPLTDQHALVHTDDGTFIIQTDKYGLGIPLSVKKAPARIPLQMIRPSVDTEPEPPKAEPPKAEPPKAESQRNWAFILFFLGGLVTLIAVMSYVDTTAVKQAAWVALSTTWSVLTKCALWTLETMQSTALQAKHMACAALSTTWSVLTKSALWTLATMQSAALQARHMAWVALSTTWSVLTKSALWTLETSKRLVLQAARATEDCILAWTRATGTGLDDFAVDFVQSLGDRKGLMPLAVAPATASAAALGAVLYALKPASPHITAAARKSTPFIVALLLWCAGSRMFLIVQAIMAFKDASWAVVTTRASDLKLAVQQAEEDIQSECGKFKAACAQFVQKLKQPAELRPAAAKLLKDGAGLSLAIVMALDEKHMVELALSVQAGVVAAAATVSSDAAANMMVAVFVTKRVEPRILAALKPYVAKIEEAGEKLKPGVKDNAAIGSKIQIAVDGAIFVAVLRFCAEHETMRKCIQPAMLGASMLLGNFGSDNAILEYGLACLAMIFQSKFASAPVPDLLHGMFYWVFALEAYLPTLSQA